jgi:uncharacterized protein
MSDVFNSVVCVFRHSFCNGFQLAFRPKEYNSIIETHEFDYSYEIKIHTGYISKVKNKTISLKKVVEELRQDMPELERRYKVKTLGIFGSYIRGEQHQGSDLDLLVEFIDPPSLLRFLEMEYYLSDLLGVKVDLVMKDALKPVIGKRILNEVVAV